MATSPPTGNGLATSSILSVTRTSKATKGVAGALHKLKAAAATVATSGGATSAGATSSSTATTILRLGKSATTLAINGGSKLEATTTTAATAAATVTTTTSNKLPNAVTTEQQPQQQPSTTTQTNVPLGNGKSRGFGITEFQMGRINCQRRFRQVLLLQVHLHRDRETKPDAVSWLKISLLC